MWMCKLVPRPAGSRRPLMLSPRTLLRIRRTLRPGWRIGNVSPATSAWSVASQHLDLHPDHMGMQPQARDERAEQTVDGVLVVWRGEI